MKISNLIFISIFFILLLFSITTYINFKQSEKVRENAAFFSSSSNFVRQINQLQRNILDMERSLRGFLLTGEQYLLQTYNSTKSDNEIIFLELNNMTADRSKQAKKLAELNTLYKQWISVFADPLWEARVKSDSFSISSSSFEKFYLNDKRKSNEEIINRKIQKNFSELRDFEYVNREDKRNILETSEQQTKVISFTLTAASIIIGFIIAFMLAKHISKRILKMVNMADSIAVGNYLVQVRDTSNDELTKLANSLNNMSIILQENISLLQRKNQELDQFAHIVSHDLKAPLRGIDNVVTWIEEDYTDAIPLKVNEYLQLIKSRILRLENLINGILSYSRIGKELQTQELVNVKALIHEIIENISIKSTLDIQIADDLPEIVTDKLLISQVFSNLVSNAVKYHNKDDGYIKIYSKENKSFYQFYVEDNGPGIATSYHDKIFVIFQTLQEKDSFESTGVGLAIVKKILEDRKEKINIISEPGKGSVFSFTWAK